MKKMFTDIVLGLALGALLGCTPPDGKPPIDGGGIISGRVYDLITGDGIADATVVFGEYSATTNASGTFSITVPTSVSSVDGVFAVFKGPDYRFRVCGSISLDPTPDPVFDIGLFPVDPTTGYINRNLSGKVYDKTPAEIADGSDIQFEFFNENGGEWSSEALYNPGTGYSTSTKSFGSNCFVVVEVKDEFSNPLFQFYRTGQDLSTDRTNYDHTQPATGFTTVTLTGSQGSMFEGYLVVPNYGWVGYSSGDLFLSSQSTQELYNPNSYPICWWTQTGVPDTPGPGDMTGWVNAVTLPFSATINLPAPYTQAAPSETVDGATASWGGNTLSFNTAAGANGYFVVLEDDAGYRGFITMNSASIALPASLVTSILSPGEGWDMEVMPVWSPQCSANQILEFSLRFAEAEGPPLGDFQAAFIMPQDVTAVDIIP